MTAGLTAHGDVIDDPAVPRPWLLSRPVRAALVTVVGVMLLGYLTRNTYRIDLDVYRIGAQTWLEGHDLYGVLPRTQIGAGLPFTYPPAAAILFVPLAVVPLSVASVAMTLACVAALTEVVALVVRSLRRSASPARWTVLAILPVALLLEPVRATIGFGQVNILLMALVAADVLLPRTPWPRGLLVGIAGAVKLTPILFVVSFLVARDRRAAVTSVASFATVTTLAWLLAPTDSIEYWTKAIWDTRRIGSVISAGNQSVNGLLLRAGLPAGAERIVWVAACALLVGLAILAMRRASDLGLPVLALACNAMLALLVSPVSWTHHWVWLIPTVLALWVAGRERWAFRMLAFIGLALALGSPMWWLPTGHGSELTWSSWQQPVGNAYILYAVTVLVVVALDGRTPAASRLRRWMRGGSAARDASAIRPSGSAAS